MADTLQDLRIARGLSQVQLAEAIGVARRTIQRWESAEMAVASGRLTTLARVLNTDADNILRAWAEMDSVDAQEISE